MADCPNCGEPLAEGASFCTNCGAPVYPGKSRKGSGCLLAGIAVGVCLTLLAAAAGILWNFFLRTDFGRPSVFIFHTGSGAERTETEPVREERILLTEPQALPTESFETEPERPNPDLWWEGDWYGWWTVSSGTGSMGEYTDLFWDCCARIRVSADGSGYVEIWDEDCEPDSCIATLHVRFGPGQTEAGCMVSESGGFLDEFFEGDFWFSDPGDHTYVTDIPNMICISGTYHDPEEADSIAECLFFLRPWGMRWEDVQAMDTSTEACKDMMPRKYDWYLAQLEAGVSEAPDQIG